MPEPEPKALPSRPPPPWSGPFASTAITLGVVSATCLLRLLLGPKVGGPFLLFYPGIVVVALYLGRDQALLATVLFSGSSYFLLIPWWGAATPLHAVLGTQPLVSTLVFCAIGVLLSVVVGRYRKLRGEVALLAKEVALQEAQDSARQFEQGYHAIFENTPLGIAEVDSATGRFQRVNRALCEILGYPAGELLARTWMDVTHPGDLQRSLDGARGVGAASYRFAAEKRYLRKDGKTIWCSLHISQLRASQPGPGAHIAVFQDISARRAAEQKSHESQEQLATILRLTTAGHVVLRQRDRVILDVNEGWTRMFGWTREEAVGKSPVELGLFLSREEREKARQDLAGGAGPAQEMMLRRKSGEAGTFLYSAVPVTLAGEAVFLGVVTDITALRKADRERRESEEYYATLFNLAPSGVLVADEAGRILACNERAHTQLGYTREEFLQLSIPQIDALPAGNQFEQRMEQAARGEPLEFETLHRSKGGELRDVHVRARLVPLGGKVRSLSVWHDISDSKRAAEAERRKEARFRALIERSTDMTVLLDAAGCITFWSPSAEARLGLPAAQAAGVPLQELVHEADRGEVLSLLAQARAAAGTPLEIKARLRRPEGSLRFIEGSCTNLLGAPEVAALVLNLRDVTEQRTLEQQLLQSQKLESFGRLAGGVAHDFNNLLTVVLSSVEQLERDLARRGPVELSDVEEVRDAGLRAADLTRQLLAFARKQTVAPVPIALDELLAGSEKLLRRVLGEDVRLEVRAGSSPWTLFADRGQIDQVLLNLAVNARDAMSGGGKLTIETSRERRGDPASADGSGPGEGVPGEEIVLRVRDTGAGMSPEVQARLFEPFFTTKGPGKGTGLGLATVHGIVSQCGGRISVESSPGRGTTFELRFPRNLVAPSPLKGPKTPVPQGEAGTVLLVEDDARVRAVTAAALQRAGYQLLIAPDGRKAIAAAAAFEGEIDLVVCDVVMPGLNGREVVDALQKQRPGLRVLFVSGYTQDVMAARGVSAGGPSFLEKPFTPSTLLARVQELLAKR
jgi:two-component system, cell cycle sensor histidine kinase and response regulator CckA